MNLKITAVAVIGLGFSLAACTGRSSRPIQVEPPKTQTPGPAGGSQQPTSPTTPGEGQTGVSSSGEGNELSLALDEAGIAKYVADVKNLDYKFTYSAISPAYAREGVLSFVGGSASIRLTGLPVDKSGDMTLEVLEKGVVKARGMASGIILRKGATPPIDLKVSQVGGDGGSTPSTDTVDVQINVKFDDLSPTSTPTPTIPVTTTPTPTTPVPTTPVPTTPVPTTPVPTTPVPTTPVPTTPTPTTVDPLSSWDGTSFKGNDKWQIKPVN